MQQQGNEKTVFGGQVGGDHYARMGQFQPWLVLKHWLTPEELRGAAKATAIIYLAREMQKGGMADIDKAIHTLQFYREMVGTPAKPVDQLAAEAGIDMNGVLPWVADMINEIREASKSTVAEDPKETSKPGCDGKCQGCEGMSPPIEEDARSIMQTVTRNKIVPNGQYVVAFYDDVNRSVLELDTITSIWSLAKDRLLPTNVFGVFEVADDQFVLLGPDHPSTKKYNGLMVSTGFIGD